MFAVLSGIFERNLSGRGRRYLTKAFTYNTIKLALFGEIMSSVRDQK